MDETGATNEEQLFAKMAKEVLSIATQACAVERINKGHGWIHSKVEGSCLNVQPDNSQGAVLFH